MDVVLKSRDVRSKEHIPSLADDVFSLRLLVMAAWWRRLSIVAYRQSKTKPLDSRETTFMLNDAVILIEFKPCITIHYNNGMDKFTLHSV